MDRLVSLKKLNLSRNKLSDVDYLLLVGFEQLAELEAAYNRLPVSYLDHMLEIIKGLPTLRTVVFMGNEMSLNKYYRVKLAAMYQLKTVDALAVKPYARRELRVGVRDCRPWRRATSWTDSWPRPTRSTWNALRTRRRSNDASWLRWTKRKDR